MKVTDASPFKTPMTAVVLAGGSSKRMATPKPLLRIGDQQLPERIINQISPYFAEILISTSSQNFFSLPPYRTVTDEKPGCGPLMAIYSSLKASSNDINFFVACDIPDIDIPFLTHLASFARDYDMVIPKTGVDKFEPLFAFYKKKLIPHMAKYIAEGVRRISTFYDCCHIKFVETDISHWYRNLNTPDDLQSYLSSTPNKS